MRRMIFGLTALLALVIALAAPTFGATTAYADSPGLNISVSGEDVLLADPRPSPSTLPEVFDSGSIVKEGQASVSMDDGWIVVTIMGLLP